MARKTTTEEIGAAIEQHRNELNYVQQMEFLDFLEELERTTWIHIDLMERARQRGIRRSVVSVPICFTGWPKVLA